MVRKLSILSFVAAALFFVGCGTEDGPDSPWGPGYKPPVDDEDGKQEDSDDKGDFDDNIGDGAGDDEDKEDNKDKGKLDKTKLKKDEDGKYIYNIIYKSDANYVKDEEISNCVTQNVIHIV